MPTCLKILCAIDFSESSRAALESAADLARRFGAALTLVHVQPPQAPGEQARDLAEAGAREMECKLEAWSVEAERLAERPVGSKVATGSPALEIVTEARNGDFDLVVTGTRSRKGPGHVPLGSVAGDVVRDAPCAVLVARRRLD